MKKITKRIMALMLSLVMMLGCIPSFTSSVNANEGNEILHGISLYWKSGPGYVGYNPSMNAYANQAVESAKMWIYTLEYKNDYLYSDEECTSLCNEIYVKDKTYYTEITLHAQDGYEFADDVKFYSDSLQQRELDSTCLVKPITLVDSKTVKATLKIECKNVLGFYNEVSIPTFSEDSTPEDIMDSITADYYNIDDHHDYYAAFNFIDNNYDPDENYLYIKDMKLYRDIDKTISIDDDEEIGDGDVYADIIADGSIPIEWGEKHYLRDYEESLVNPESDLELKNTYSVASAINMCSPVDSHQIYYVTPITYSFDNLKDSMEIELFYKIPDISNKTSVNSYEIVSFTDNELKLKIIGKNFPDYFQASLFLPSEVETIRDTLDAQKISWSEYEAIDPERLVINEDKTEAIMTISMNQPLPPNYAENYEIKGDETFMLLTSFEDEDIYSNYLNTIELCPYDPLIVHGLLIGEFYREIGLANEDESEFYDGIITKMTCDGMELSEGDEIVGGKTYIVEGEFSIEEYIEFNDFVPGYSDFIFKGNDFCSADTLSLNRFYYDETAKKIYFKAEIEFPKEGLYFEYLSPSEIDDEMVELFFESSGYDSSFAVSANSIGIDCYTDTYLSLDNVSVEGTIDNLYYTQVSTYFEDEAQFDYAENSIKNGEFVLNLNGENIAKYLADEFDPELLIKNGTLCVFENEYDYVLSIYQLVDLRETVEISYTEPTNSTYTTYDIKNITTSSDLGNSEFETSFLVDDMMKALNQKGIQDYLLTTLKIDPDLFKGKWIFETKNKTNDKGPYYNYKYKLNGIDASYMGADLYHVDKDMAEDMLKSANSNKVYYYATENDVKLYKVYDFRQDLHYVVNPVVTGTDIADINITCLEGTPLIADPMSMNMIGQIQEMSPTGETNTLNPGDKIKEGYYYAMMILDLRAEAACAKDIYLNNTKSTYMTLADTKSVDDPCVVNTYLDYGMWGNVIMYAFIGTTYTEGSITASPLTAGTKVKDINFTYDFGTNVFTNENSRYAVFDNSVGPEGKLLNDDDSLEAGKTYQLLVALVMEDVDNYETVIFNGETLAEEENYLIDSQGKELTAWIDFTLEPAPTSSGSKSYKATDKEDTVAKIAGSGKKGSTRTITPIEGRKVASVKVVDKNGNEIPVTMNEDGTYSFEQPASNVDVLVSYKNREITLNIGSTEASVDGERENLDVCPVIRNDRTMLPIRFVAENLGAKVEWNEKNSNYVVITRGDTKIEISLGSDIMKVNGKDVKLDSVAFAENDRTYLPVRAVSEALNAIVEWHENEPSVVRIYERQ